MRFPIRRPAALAAPALALTIAACSGDGPTGPRAEPILPGQAAAIGYLVMPSLYHSTGGLMGFEVSPYGPLLAVRTAETARGNARLFDLAGCPSFDPDPFPDADADGVPDHTTFSFDAAGCDESDQAGSKDWYGALRVSDPGAGLGYNLDYLGYGVTLVSIPNGSTDATESDGTRRLRGDSSTLSLAERLDFRYRTNAAGPYRVRTDWELDFTAKVAGTVTGADLPAGWLVVDGGITIDDDDKRYALVVETVDALYYEPACYAFIGGTFRAYTEGREAEGEVRVSFNPCGVQPTIQFVPGQA